MDTKRLAGLLFPNVTMTPEELEEKYPPRDLPEGAKVTRFAPSPTGYVHFGGVYQAVVDYMLAHQSNGVFMLRIEDTDGQREVKGAVEALINTLRYYGMSYDEGVTLDEDGNITESGKYGPYKQSKRGDIYAVYAKKLVEEGKAYPCFTTEEELEAIQQADKKAEIKNTDWHTAAAEKREAMLAGRNFTIEEVEVHLAAGDPFVIRILADGDPDKKTKFTDQVKGNLELPENDEDFVLLKSDGIPTYHFAHAVDDHLMRTTHVIRGEDWLPSLPKHIQLFRYLGFRMPKYLHTAQILKTDENGNKKKISKRDMGAKMDDYAELGYSTGVVWEYLLTLLNSNFEEWRMQNPDVDCRTFPFSIKKMSISGCLFDFDKLNDVAKNVVCRMSAEDVYDSTLAWAEKYDTDFADHLKASPDMAKAALGIGRGGAKPRKDFGRWDEVKGYMGFFFDDYFTVSDAYPDKFAPADIKAVLNDYADSYDASADRDAWFAHVKAIGEKHNFCPDMKTYKKDPDSYKGSVADVSMFLRVAVTGRLNSPDLYDVMQILGTDRTLDRIRKMADSL